jgi:hypothetical protein
MSLKSLDITHHQTELLTGFVLMLMHLPAVLSYCGDLKGRKRVGFRKLLKISVVFLQYMA